MRVSDADFIKWHERKRAHFINCLSGFKSANLLGTQDKAGNTNLAIVSSVVHLGASPALIGMVIRPHTVPRHSFENLLETGFYTLNHVNSAMVEKAHLTSARFDKLESEFTASGLHVEEAGFAAPYVKESKLKMGVKFISTQTLLNGTEFVIGEIKEVIVSDENALSEDGFVDLHALDTVAVTGLDSYHKASPGTRYAYAKPDEKVTPLKT